jgi:3D-(3,5/4)-trihydroxycyclohexane-1,2-dione acylhydrolase (decyclizing)
MPVLLLPGDTFASRDPAPVLQQLEQPWAGDVTVNDCLRPVSRYFDRIQRPEQLTSAMFEAMRVLTDPADTGAVTVCLPQDVQTEAYHYADELFAPRTWTISRRRADPRTITAAVELIQRAHRPLIVAGGGVIYSGASEALTHWSARTGIPVAETQAGKGAMPWGCAGAVGAVGVTGTLAANRLAANADLVIGIGTRWTDFTTGSKTSFANPEVRFVNVNVAAIDLVKHGALMIDADALATIESLDNATMSYSAGDTYRAEVASLIAEWEREVGRLYQGTDSTLPSQAQIIGAVEAATGIDDVLVAAAGSAPGDLHKLWRARRPGGYHVEYGYSTMGYEIAGALGVKLAAREREVFVIVGDGSWLMLSSEIVTAIQERLKLIVVLIDNRGFASIGALSRSVGGSGFGTRYRYRVGDALSLDPDGEDAEHYLPLDLAANAASLGATVFRADSASGFLDALQRAKEATGIVVIVVCADRMIGVPSYEAWWEVPVPAVSAHAEVREARARYVEGKRRQRHYLGGPTPSARQRIGALDRTEALDGQSHTTERR